MDINQTDRTDDLVLALAASIKTSKIPFHIYDASFFSGEGMLEGDILVIAETPKSEYAIVIETTNIASKFGMAVVHKIYYPYFDTIEGLEDEWIIDYDVEHPDYATEGLVDTCLHTVNWFLNREIIDSIDTTLSNTE